MWKGQRVNNHSLDKKNRKKKEERRNNGWSCVRVRAWWYQRHQKLMRAWPISTVFRDTRVNIISSSSFSSFFFLSTMESGSSSSSSFFPLLTGGRLFHSGQRTWMRECAQSACNKILFTVQFIFRRKKEIQKQLHYCRLLFYLRLGRIF